MTLNLERFYPERLPLKNLCFSEKPVTIRYLPTYLYDDWSLKLGGAVLGKSDFYKNNTFDWFTIDIIYYK